MRVRISSTALAAIHAHAAAEPDREVCGLLLGTEGSIEQAVATANVADDPARRFEIGATDLFAAIRAERAGGVKLIGYYHSHPTGSAAPSATDLAMAARDDRLWLICAGDAVTGWRSTANGFQAVEIVVVPLAPGESVRH